MKKRFFSDRIIWVMTLLAVITTAIIVGVAVSKNKSSSETEPYSELPTTDIIAKLDDEPTTRKVTQKETSTSTTTISNEQTTLNNEDVTTSPTEEQEAGISIKGVLFANSHTLHWPVVGNIILDYSMDTTVYFPTLDTYRTNPGIVIQSEPGTNVLSAANGTVKEVASNAEIGEYVVIDLGSGYTAIYGQLRDICVKAGDVVSIDDKLGTVDEPTKYYSVEGANLYFELRENDLPIDPVEYFAY